MVLQDSTGSTKRSKVSFLISETVANHIFNSSSFQRRIIFFDAAFKKMNKRICIINTYLPADPNNNKSEFKSTLAMLNMIISEVETKNYNIILMGNFNNNINTYYLTPYRNSLLHKLYNQFLCSFWLIDTHKEFFEHPKFTWSKSSGATSRIDLIFTSSDILTHIYNANSLDVNSIINDNITDH